ncbi:F0F1 ATP synthase subunit epsilon [Chachezhania antarctica]|uniref:F0F1 ATP synthase subunit epsilon n=1 Tax=Chachezhania antarctica TaxID=2340860 RepID=UPI000EAC06C0|nr:F0F1 ATP synthase subunit epsilon [Chachezhania antarctica]|tara:strand:+ start:374 stop:790 length:417 start_codon:yes stop_codon:yes gene_type:complete
MADTMQFDLVSPERRLASLKATMVELPATEGRMTAMPNHMPLITTLRPGLVKVEGPEGTLEYLITGGFAEINEDAMSVLAEQATPVDEVNRSHIDELVADARAKLEAAKASPDAHHGLVDDAAKLLADMEALGDHMRL